MKIINIYVMDIIKFNQYIKESINLNVLDLVIDNFGKIVTAKVSVETGKIKTIETLPIKGNIERVGGKILKIFGSDGKFYPAGINKNGLLEKVFSDESNLINIEVDERTGDVIKINRPLQIHSDLIVNGRSYDGNDIIDSNNNEPKYWATDINYYELVPNIPTGWVNVKVDMEVSKRVRRYSSGIKKYNTRHISPHNTFIYKISEISRVSQNSNIKNTTRVDIQKNLSIILLLHYINEIKDHFTPSSSGFLLESFLAGLIPNAKVNDNNSDADIISGDIKYQVKFVSSSSDIEITKSKSGKYLDYYLICIKNYNSIDIYIIDKKTLNDNKKYINIRNNKKEFFSTNIRKDNKDILKLNIDLSNIQGRISDIGTDIKNSLDMLYNELSLFQYNVESLVTGVNEKGILLDDEEYENCHSAGEKNLKSLIDQLEKLKNDINNKAM